MMLSICTDLYKTADSIPPKSKYQYKNIQAICNVIYFKYNGYILYNVKTVISCTFVNLIVIWFGMYGQQKLSVQ